MAFRRPLYYFNGDLREMSDSQIQDIRTQMFWKYIESPSVTLSQFFNGNLGVIGYDTYLNPGAYSTSTTAYPSESTTAEPFYTRTPISTMSQNIENLTSPSDFQNVNFPLFYTSTGNLQAMSLQDMYDTFAYSTIDSLILSNQIYTYSTSDISGYTRLFNIHTDTYSNLSAYSASNIPVGTQLTGYIVTYVYKRNASPISYVVPVKATSSSNPDIQSYSQSSFDSILSTIIRFTATNVSGYRIRYSINGQGNNTGALTDRYYSGGSGNYQQRFVGDDDYRAQEFPNGTLTSDVYYLRVRKE